MRINAIRSKKADNKDFSTWKFHPGQGRLANLTIADTNEIETQELIAALGWTLLNQEQELLTDAAVSISDDDGNIWLVEKSPRGCKVLRNAQPISESELEKDLLEVIWQAKSYEDNIGKTRLNIAKFKLSLTNNGLVAEELTEYDQISRGIGGLATEKINYHLSECQRLLQNQWVPDASQVARMLHKLPQLHRSLCEVQRLRRDLPKLMNHEHLPTLEEWQKLERQMELISDIEAIATPLLEPSANPKLLREKFIRTEEELKQLSESIEQPCHLKVREDIPWSKLVDALTRVDIFKKMLAASEKALLSSHETYGLVLREHAAIMEDILSNDRRITAELESALSLVATQVHRQQQIAANSQKVSGFIRRFLKPKGHSETPLEEASNDPMDTLDTVRQCIDFALSRLGELHSDSTKSKTQQDVFALQLQSVHEAIAKEFGRVRSAWTALATKYEIPFDTNLNRLLKLINNQARLVELQQRYEKLRDQINQRQQSLTTLNQLILDWRVLTNSQKEGELSTPEIILAEAQSILRFSAQKGEKLQRLKQYSEEMKVHNNLKNQLDSRIFQLKTKWDEALSEFGLPMLAANDPTWDSFFGRGYQIASLQELLSTYYRPRPLAELAAQENLASPITLILAGSTLSSPGGTSSLQTALEAYCLEGPVILFGVVKQAFEQILKARTGSLRRIVMPPKRNPSTTGDSEKSAEPVKTQVHQRKAAIAASSGHTGKTLLSRRAQQALAVLQQNRV